METGGWKTKTGGVTLLNRRSGFLAPSSMPYALSPMPLLIKLLHQFFQFFLLVKTFAISPI